jgi:hypothetical protein
VALLLPCDACEAVPDPPPQAAAHKDTAMNTAVSTPPRRDRRPGLALPVSGLTVDDDM